MNRKVVVAVIAIVVVLLILWWLRQPDDDFATSSFDEAPPTQPATPAPAPRPEPAPDFEQRTPQAEEEVSEVTIPVPPSLAESDEPAQAVVEELSPDLLRWVTPQEKVRKVVLLTDLAASGRVPVKNRPVNFPAGEFKVAERDGELYLDEATYARANRLVDVITAIPPEQLARYYQAWAPLLEEAYAELGRKEPFATRVEKAMAEILATEPLEGEVRLAQPSVYYTFADPELERASDVRKLMWRLGPENTRKLQDYIRRLQPLLEQGDVE
ncbi:MAG: DUF3014 domain-containing protein [Spongiibacteraceae bacterium]|jgi:hypothetical protein|nr:DUF3014 domain-containing protein [Spongiibacteraceae bacterium]